MQQVFALFFSHKNPCKHGAKRVSAVRGSNLFFPSLCIRVRLVTAGPTRTNSSVPGVPGLANSSHYSSGKLPPPWFLRCSSVLPPTGGLRWNGGGTEEQWSYHGRRRGYGERGIRLTSFPTAQDV